MNIEDLANLEFKIRYGMVAFGDLKEVSLKLIQELQELRQLNELHKELLEKLDEEE